MVAKKGKQTKSFYTNKDFLKWEKSTKNTNLWDIEYKKGLAALENEEYKEIIQNPNSFILTKEDNFDKILDIWFSGDSDPRKRKILGADYTEIIKNNKSLF